MNKQGILGSLVVVGVLLVVGFFWFVGNFYDIGDNINILDDAGVYCIRQGFVWEVRGEGNDSIGWCVSEDGQECEGWEFFYGECGFVGYELCVKDSCCHASGCVWEGDAPDCSDSFCTMECAEGTMDCGSGHCEVVDGECEVVWDDEA